MSQHFGKIAIFQEGFTISANKSGALTMASAGRSGSLGHNGQNIVWAGDTDKPGEARQTPGWRDAVHE